MKYFSMLAAMMTVCSCVGAQQRYRESMAGGHLVAIAAGTFDNGVGVVAGTYVIAPSTSLCFFSAYMVEGASSGPAGTVSIDCCRLRKIPEVLAALPSLGDTCVDAAPAAPAAAAQPAPRG